MSELNESQTPAVDSPPKTSSRRSFLGKIVYATTGATLGAVGSRLMDTEILQEMRNKLLQLKAELERTKILLLTSIRYVEILTHHVKEQNTKLPTCIVCAVDPNDPGNIARIIGFYGPSALDYETSPDLQEIAKGVVATVYPDLIDWEIRVTNVDHTLPLQPEPLEPYTPPIREPKRTET